MSNMIYKNKSIRSGMGTSIPCMGAHQIPGAKANFPSRAHLHLTTFQQKNFYIYLYLRVRCRITPGPQFNLGQPGCIHLQPGMHIGSEC